jgi:hypothetical protein
MVDDHVFGELTYQVETEIKAKIFSNFRMDIIEGKLNWTTDEIMVSSTIEVQLYDCRSFFFLVQIRF